ncbi:MAG: 2OG-Fe(II) oxygenase [Lysobacterales bacterium]
MPFPDDQSEVSNVRRGKGALTAFSLTSVEEQLDLARKLLFGIDGAPEPLQAIALLSRAESGGSTTAGLLLAQIAVGDTLLALNEDADSRLLRAVDARFPPALRAAALVFARKPHAQSQKLATQLLRAAAARGDAVAALLLAERIAIGRGCLPDAAGAQELWTQLEQAGTPRLPQVSVAQAAPSATAIEADDAQSMNLRNYVMGAPPATALATEPTVRHLDGLLNAEECRLLMALATPLLHPSLTVDPRTGQPVEMQLRTSHDAPFDVLHEDLALRLVQARMAAAAQLPLDQAEQLIVLRYEPGQEYRRHRDYLPPDAIARDRPGAGNRLRTICVYLNDVEAGGATTFPDANLRIEPRAGDAIVFDNLTPDGQPDTRSLHAGLPVERGVKWLATLWFRQRPYRYF